jgi:TRAP-type uncharacterized transport system fused permease subunit
MLKPLNLLERVLLFAAALALIDAGLMTDLIGYALIGVALLMQKTWSWRPKEAISPLIGVGSDIKER